MPAEPANTTRTAHFTSANNARILRIDEYRVWAHGESTIVRSLDRARRVAARASWWASDIQIINANDDRVR